MHLSNPGPTQNVSKSPGGQPVNSILVKLKVSYDISFLYHAQFIIDGDVESNPGPTSVESYRASIGVFYNKGRHLSNIEEFNTKVMFFQCIFKLFGFAFQ